MPTIITTLSNYKNSLKQVTLARMYAKLSLRFGPQHWWPAETPFEVMVGAILTQNTNWQNVERAIANLRKNRCLSARLLKRLPHARLAALIKPAGYFNVKAKRLKHFLEFFCVRYKASTRAMMHRPLAQLRQELLDVHGIGPETADSILLYALGKPVFVVDAYTKRIFSRHGLVSQKASYDQLQQLCMRQMRPDAKVYNEFHALLVKAGKEYCLKKRGRCEQCPLKS